MDSSSISFIEEGVKIYEPPLREYTLQHNETSRLQRIKGSPRIWYVDVYPDEAGIFKLQSFSDTENQRAAYLASQIVGFDIVPISVIRDIDGKKGSLTELVKDPLFLDEIEINDSIGEGLYTDWIFRHIIRNPEGRDDNLLVKDGKIISLDHEASFDPFVSDPSYFDEYRKFYGSDAPKGLIKIFKSYRSDSKKQALLKSVLGNLISQNDINITLRLINKIGRQLIEKGKITSPGELSII